MKPELPLEDNLVRMASPASTLQANGPARTVLRIDRVSEPTSARVLAQVTANPGITIRQVAVALGFSHATCSYHLQALVRNGLASRVSDGRDVRFFPAGQYSVLSHLRVLVADPVKKTLARFVVEHREDLPGMTLNEVAGQVGVRFGFLKRTMLQFERIGFVYIGRRGSRYLVWPVNDALTRDVLSLLASNE
ncbi:MAG TPA: winged helix-turn-helix transcriptional regulator [Candidatus Thermoplasmatota archaeon]|nr:winged helix-turn-helix transcriptional regulator [Candidatus Thermoplasmatota archaeon]